LQKKITLAHFLKVILKIFEVIQMKIEQITARNLEIIEKFFKDAQSIIEDKQNKAVQRKRLYSARYWANYFMQINNHLTNQHLTEK